MNATTEDNWKIWWIAATFETRRYIGEQAFSVTHIYEWFDAKKENKIMRLNAVLEEIRLLEKSGFGSLNFVRSDSAMK